jgi:hypothetical protein
MGKVDKGVKCSVLGCNNQAERSLSYSRASMANSLNLDKTSNKVYLCKEHYKIWKRETKEERTLERERWA